MFRKIRKHFKEKPEDIILVIGIPIIAAIWCIGVHNFKPVE